jgi:hypothetical protein
MLGQRLPSQRKHETMLALPPLAFCGGVEGVAGENGRRVRRRVLREVLEDGVDVPHDLLHVKNALRQCVLRVMPESCAAALAAFCAIPLQRVTRSACAFSCAAVLGSKSVSVDSLTKTPRS